MRIIETFWSNFRNLKPRRLEWCSGLNVVTGRNGAGKTNVLEALNVICGWGGFEKSNTKKDLISWNNCVEHNCVEHNTNSASLTARVEGEECSQIDVSITHRMSAKLDKDKISFSELRTRVPSLCFLPRDMEIIGGTPAVRRAFIDKICALLSPPYAKRLADYRRIVRHRIKLLKSGKPPDITNSIMAALGAWIWSVRGGAVRLISENFRESRLSPVSLKIEMKNQPLHKEEFLEKLEFYAPREREAKIPFVGPHRDDILITDGEREASRILSRGQKRRATIALLIAGGNVLENKLRRAPIFLIDELASELDENARNIVTDALVDTGWQVFAACAEGTRVWRGHVFEVKDGEIFDKI